MNKITLSDFTVTNLPIQGKIITKIERNDCNDHDWIKFYTDDNEVYHMYHEQDCCENVYIEDIIGDLDDLIGFPVVMAEEATRTLNEEEAKIYESGMWTFYKFATLKGYVDIRWLGTSNGYYSEAVNFNKI